jgi:hypothetical protein
MVKMRGVREDFLTALKKQQQPQQQKQSSRWRVAQKSGRTFLASLLDPRHRIPRGRAGG